jgi:hypothetical protein
MDFGLIAVVTVFLRIFHEISPALALLWITDSIEAKSLASLHGLLKKR